jgi:hypothetical protein
VPLHPHLSQTVNQAAPVPVPLILRLLIHDQAHFLKWYVTHTHVYGHAPPKSSAIEITGAALYMLFSTLHTLKINYRQRFIER